MNLAVTVSLYAYGTSEGVRKGWDTRGRKTPQELLPAAQGLLEHWKKKILEADSGTKFMPTTKAYLYKSGFIRNSKPESAAVWIAGKSGNGEQFGLDLRMLPEESGGTALHIGDSWLPKDWQGKGLYSVAVQHLTEQKEALGLNGNMYVHNSMNDPPWEHIAKKFGLKWVNH